MRANEQKYVHSEQNRKQDQECADFIMQQENGRKEHFAREAAAITPFVTDATAPLLFCYDLMILEGRLVELHTEVKTQFSFDLDCPLDETATTEWQPVGFTSGNDWRRVLDDNTLHQQLVAKIGEFQEIKARWSALLMCRDCGPGTPSERYFRFLEMLPEVSAGIWNEHSLAHCVSYGANDILAGMVESLTKLSPHGTERERGNRLHKALSQMDNDAREQLWIELLSKLPPNQMPSIRDTGSGMKSLRNKVTNKIYQDNRPQPDTVSMYAPIGEANPALIIEDTLGSIEGGFNAVEQGLEYLDVLRMVTNRKRRVEFTLLLDDSGYSDQQIADLFGECVSTVRKRLLRRRPDKSA